MKLPKIKIGMRTIKTAIAVTICVLLGESIRQSSPLSCVACIISIQDTVKNSLKRGSHRVYSTILGGVIGYFLSLIKPGDAILSGIGVIIVIYMSNLLKLNSPVVGAVTFLAILLGVSGKNPFMYSVNRVIDTVIGVVVGVCVNYFIARPDYLASTIDKFERIEKITYKYLQEAVIDRKEINLKELQEHIKKLDSVYSKYIDEVNYSFNNPDVKILEQTIEVCREIYFHMQSIHLLRGNLYLKKDTYDYLIDFFGIEKLNWEINEEKSPVFNYHLMEILHELEYLKQEELEEKFAQIENISIF
ncbi:MAG: aromatic acid exporter family protein [Clostridioides sp.]|nr:aromatic acid exporter family protein [Clostridioides sp.]